jgi:hypothetical protein
MQNPEQARYLFGTDTVTPSLQKNDGDHRFRHWGRYEAFPLSLRPDQVKAPTVFPFQGDFYPLADSSRSYCGAMSYSRRR